MEFTIQQKIDVLRRELGMRRRVYPRQVEQGKMLASRAMEETDIMAAILADYQAQLAKDPDLFSAGGAR